MRFSEIQIGQQVKIKPARAEAYGEPESASTIFVVRALQPRPGYKTGFVYLQNVEGCYRESDLIKVK